MKLLFFSCCMASTGPQTPYHQGHTTAMVSYIIIISMQTM